MDFRKRWFHWGGFSQIVSSPMLVFENCDYLFHCCGISSTGTFDRNFFDRDFLPGIFWPGFLTGNFRKFFAKSKFAKSSLQIPSILFDDFTTGPNFAKVSPATVALSPISIFFLSFSNLSFYREKCNTIRKHPMGPHMVELFKGGVRKIGPGEKSRVFSRFSKKGTAVESIEIAR